MADRREKQILRYAVFRQEIRFIATGLLSTEQTKASNVKPRDRHSLPTESFFLTTIVYSRMEVPVHFSRQVFLVTISKDY